MEEINVEMCPYIFNGNYCDTCQDYCENISDCEYKQLKRLEEKYNKMVEISKENLIKYEDLRIDNQKLIIEIENLKSQIDFEAQKQEILLKENARLKEEIEIRDNLSKKFRNEAISWANIANECQKDKTEFEQENEELKEQFEIETLKNNDTNECIYRSNLLNKYKYALEEIKGTIKHFKTYFSEKELNKVKFSDIIVIEEIIAEAIGE